MRNTAVIRSLLTVGAGFLLGALTVGILAGRFNATASPLPAVSAGASYTAGAATGRSAARAARRQKDGKKPNILFIMGDDIG